MTRLMVLAIALLVPVRSAVGIQKNAEEVFQISHDGVIRSIKGSDNWVQANAGLPQGIGALAAPITAIASTEDGGQQVYALTETDGVYRWINGDKAWVSAHQGLPVPLLRRTEGSLLAVDPADGNRVYTLLNIPVTSEREHALLFGSDDGGRTWAQLKDLSEIARIVEMSVEQDGGLRLKTVDGTFYTIAAPNIAAIGDSDVTITSLLGDATPLVGSRVSFAEDVNNIAVIEDDGLIVGREVDIANRSFEFRPTAGGSYDLVAIERTFDDDTGDLFLLGDEDSRFLSLPFSFSFYGVTRTSMFINSNGSLSFLQGDLSSFPTVDAFVAGAPRISPLWNDFDPRTGGIYLKRDADKIIVSWLSVPVYATTVPNNFQVVLFPDGRIRFNYRDLGAKTGIVGIGNGFQTATQTASFSSLPAMRNLEQLPILQDFRIPDIDIVRLAERFYQTHDDDYDALVIFGAGGYPTNIAGSPGSTALSAYYAGIKNDVFGVGQSVVDASAFVGSAGRLQGVINMNRLSQYPDDITLPIPNSPDSAITILGQEWGHRFGTFVRFRDGSLISSALLGRSASHWSHFMNSEASVMEGNEWRDDGNGSFTATDVVRRYSRLDQYLMGLRTASEVPPVMLITNPQPVFSGSITSFDSTMGFIENAIRETGKNFGPVDSLRNFLLRVAPTTSSTSFSSALIYSNSRNDDGPALDTVSTRTMNFRLLASSGSGVPYQITHLASSAPHARYFDSNTGRFTGDNITIRGTRKDVLIDQILEYEGERRPAAGSAPTAFRHGFILVVPPGSQPTSTDLARMDIVRRGWESFYRTATDGLASVSTQFSTGVSRVSRQVRGGGIATIGSAGIGGAPNVAYGRLEVGTDRASGVAFLTGRSGTRITTETAVPALGTIRRSRVYIERTSTINTGIVAAAPIGAATVRLQLRDSDGTVVASSALELGNGSQVSRFVNELFSSYTFPATFRGSLSLTSGVPIAVVSLRTAVNESSEFLMTTAPAADLSELTSSASYLSHFADGAGYVTDAILMNTESTPITGSLEWRSPAGVRLFTASRYTIPAHGVAVLSTSGTGTLQSGYVAVRADDGQTGPVLRSIIGLRQNGRLVAITGMFPSASARRAHALVDLSAGHDSGLAILNDGSSPAAVRLSVYNSGGSALSLTTTVTLPAGVQTSRFVSQLFPSLPVGFRGVLEISSDNPIQAVTLRSTTIADRFLLAAFPVEFLDTQRTDAVLYFPQIVDGAGYSSEIFLMNSGSAVATPRVLFMSPQGQPVRMSFASTQ